MKNLAEVDHDFLQLLVGSLATPRRLLPLSCTDTETVEVGRCQFLWSGTVVPHRIWVEMGHIDEFTHLRQDTFTIISGATLKTYIISKGLLRY